MIPAGFAMIPIRFAMVRIPVWNVRFGSEAVKKFRMPVPGSLCL